MGNLFRHSIRHVADITVSAATRHHANPVNKYSEAGMSSFIAPQATTVAAFRVAGIAVRTTNARLRPTRPAPASARCGTVSSAKAGNTGCPARRRWPGVLCLQRLCSDQHGAFDVTAGVAALADHQVLQGATTVDIEAGAPPGV